MKYFRLVNNNATYSRDDIREFFPDDIRDYVFGNWNNCAFSMPRDRVISLILDCGYDLKFVNDLIRANGGVLSVYHFVKPDKKILD